MNFSPHSPDTNTFAFRLLSEASAGTSAAAAAAAAASDEGEKEGDGMEGFEDEGSADDTSEQFVAMQIEQAKSAFKRQRDELNVIIGASSGDEHTGMFIRASPRLSAKRTRNAQK
jgi:hypothetical protein